MQKKCTLEAVSFKKRKKGELEAWGAEAKADTKLEADKARAPVQLRIDELVPLVNRTNQQNSELVELRKRDELIMQRRDAALVKVDRKLQELLQSRREYMAARSARKRKCNAQDKQANIILTSILPGSDEEIDYAASSRSRSPRSQNHNDDGQNDDDHDNHGQHSDDDGQNDDDDGSDGGQTSGSGMHPTEALEGLEAYFDYKSD